MSGLASVMTLDSIHKTTFVQIAHMMPVVDLLRWWEERERSFRWRCAGVDCLELMVGLSVVLQESLRAVPVILVRLDLGMAQMSKHRRWKQVFVIDIVVEK